ncbi:hypothetical protein B0H13DRAFT_2320659 [Mycena leptocephala]|nr:hypothetical protein B0H13DRAFT_2320659 [Mycena leptocephala]
MVSSFEASQIYSSNIDEKTFHRVYFTSLLPSRLPLSLPLPPLDLFVPRSSPFIPFVEAAHTRVGVVMCAYSKINQMQACQNSKIIKGVLKEELRFMDAFPRFLP